MPWISQLLQKRRQRAPIQAFRMLRFHSTPFSSLLANIFDVMDRYDAKYTYPIVGSIALKNPELVHSIVRSGHEVAVHGFKHVRYRNLLQTQQEYDMHKAVEVFKKLGISAKGFRAPYNGYTQHTHRLIEKYGFSWDAGIGYGSEYNELAKPFKVDVDNHHSSFTCLPLSHWSDDLMIDTYGFNCHQIGEILKRQIKRTSERQGVVMFDLHPIRIGQRRYVDALRQALEFGTALNGRFPSVSEAVEQWNRRKTWNHNAGFCCLFTGDIDTITFTDYLRRLQY
jgi:peptidoglycan/xylan/chitin deacetylase (PgdA/CDA1 family)